MKQTRCKLLEISLSINARHVCLGARERANLYLSERCLLRPCCAYVVPSLSIGRGPQHHCCPYSGSLREQICPLPVFPHTYRLLNPLIDHDLSGQNTIKRAKGRARAVPRTSCVRALARNVPLCPCETRIFLRPLDRGNPVLPTRERGCRSPSV